MNTMSPNFHVGDSVRWYSQAGGSLPTTKVGKVVVIVPPDTDPLSAAAKIADQYDSSRCDIKRSLPRQHESYLVLVQQVDKKGVPLRSRLYWPRVCHLERIDP
jgi:hypothetical protein